ncbi:hypothetical protein KUTeg_012022 [Tegillarca granosa]|uniref:Uncharacterized protein n=1 Tax=Tegillarca granosa TaxID=220873 RepID=A0ABQ9F1K7_TEGGR|nr:hypothetical protein KUTeg_012022 [Tegillarca granosa]
MIFKIQKQITVLFFRYQKDSKCINNKNETKKDKSKLLSSPNSEIRCCKREVLIPQGLKSKAHYHSAIQCIIFILKKLKGFVDELIINYLINCKIIFQLKLKEMKIKCIRSVSLKFHWNYVNQSPGRHIKYM